MRSAMRGGQLTQQLLAYARRQNLSPRPVDVNAVIIGMGELLQRSLGGLVQVETDLAADLWPATSDPTQLELVVLNLAINSRDAMPNGGRLRIATAQCAAEHDAARLDRTRSGRLRADRGDRYRRGHDPRRPGARVRAVLHHQGDRQGQRPRARAGLRRGDAVRRHGAACQRTRCRHDGGGLPAACPGRAGKHRNARAACRRHRRVAAAPFWWWTTIPMSARSRPFSCARRAIRSRRPATDPRHATSWRPAGSRLALVDYAMPMMSGYEFVRLARVDPARSARDLRDRRRAMRWDRARCR